jgi:hypothetical protein
MPRLPHKGVMSASIDMQAIMLPMSSTLRHQSGVPGELLWFLTNYGLLNFYVFILAIGQGLVLVATWGGSIPGWTDSPIEQLVSYGLTFVLFTSAVIGLPILAVSLVVWRALIQLAGHPRLWAAFVIAVTTAVLAALLGDHSRPEYVLLVLGLMLPFAAVVRLPQRRPLE